MDPNATLNELFDAFANGNRSGATTALIELTDWLLAGGFMPDDPRGPQR